jgi:DNA-binding XRE family transcriptional regulator
MTIEVNGVHAPKRVQRAGKCMVVLDEAEYQRLLTKADEWEPAMPPPDADGNYPAFEAMAVIQARDILRDRRRLGLSQQELARLAGIRQHTLNLIERAQSQPNMRAIDKIDRALKKAARTRHSA